MIKRTQAQDQLQAWLDGEQTAEQVWLWAYNLKQESSAYEDDLVRDIIDILAVLPQDLITVEEAEIMLYGLSNPPEEADLAQNLLWNHLDALDTEQRRMALADDPFYSDFCGPIA